MCDSLICVGDSVAACHLVGMIGDATDVVRDVLPPKRGDPGRNRGATSLTSIRTRGEDWALMLMIHQTVIAAHM